MNTGRNTGFLNSSRSPFHLVSSWSVLKWWINTASPSWNGDQVDGTQQVEQSGPEVESYPKLIAIKD